MASDDKKPDPKPPESWYLKAAGPNAPEKPLSADETAKQMNNLPPQFKAQVDAAHKYEPSPMQHVRKNGDDGSAKRFRHPGQVPQHDPDKTKKR